MIIKLIYILAGIGFLVAIWALFGVFQPVGTTGLTPIGHIIGFGGFTIFGTTMIQMAQSFKNLEQKKEAKVE